jgi:type I restriction enzyme M protein
VTDLATFNTTDAGDENLGDLLLEVFPGDDNTMGNQSARLAMSRAADLPISEEEYEAVKAKALALGMVRKGRGCGGVINTYNSRSACSIVL